MRHHYSTFHGDTTFECIAFFIEFTKVSLEHITLFGVEFFRLVVMSCTVCEHFHLLVNELVVYLYIVVVNSILTCKFDIEFRCNSDVELKSIGSWLFKLYCFLCFRSHRLSEHMYFVVYNIFLKIFTQDFINGIHLYLWTNLAFQQPHWHLSRTETWNICTLAIVFECLLNFFLVICFFDNNGQKTIQFVGIFK